MSERILITGGAGCIGSDLAAELVCRGDEVLVLDNFSSGKEEHIARLRSNRKFQFINGDLLEFDTVVGMMRNIDIVYHLAANPDVKFSHGDPTDKDLRQNTLAT